MVSVRKWLTVALPLAVLIVAITGVGLSQRPKVYYGTTYISPLSPFPPHWNFNNGNLSIPFGLYNRGKSVGLLSVIFEVENAVISNETIEPYMNYEETKVSFPLRVHNQIEGYNWFFSVYPKNNAQNFSLSYRVIKKFEFSFTGLESYIFGELVSWGSTRATYGRTDSNTYELVSTE